MLVSVVIPAYNQAAYLREALHSALTQTHRELEVIVIDDGSTDDTRAVCESFADDRLRYVHQDNDGTRGIGARNRAMLLARGDWIALLDQDDRWAPDKLEKQLRRAAEVPAAGAVFCRARFIDGAGLATGEQRGDLAEGDVFHALLSRNLYHAATGIFRRSLLSVVGLPHAWVGLGDHALWLVIARRAPVAAVDELLADYRVHAQGYQASQRRSDLLRFAHDGWQLAMLHPGLLHVGCRDCDRAHARARRGAAKSYFRAIAAQWRAGRFKGSGGALKRACTLAPLWLLQPWVLLTQAVSLLTSAARGLVSPAA